MEKAAEVLLITMHQLVAQGGNTSGFSQYFSKEKEKDGYTATS